MSEQGQEMQYQSLDPESQLFELAVVHFEEGFSPKASQDLQSCTRRAKAETLIRSKARRWLPGIAAHLERTSPVGELRAGWISLLRQMGEEHDFWNMPSNRLNLVLWVEWANRTAVEFC